MLSQNGNPNMLCMFTYFKFDGCNSLLAAYKHVYELTCVVAT